MNTQQIFDTVATHLFAQGRPAVKKDGRLFMCQYRGDNGMKCAIGALIPDSAYETSMEDKSVIDLVQMGSFDLPSYFDRHQNLLSALQVVHDYPVDGPIQSIPLKQPPVYSEGELKIRLRRVAVDYGLSDEVLTTLKLGAPDAV